MAAERESACQGQPMTMLCAAERSRVQAFQELAAKAQQLANEDRAAWARAAPLLIENSLAPFTALPTGDILNIYTGEQRRTEGSTRAPTAEQLSEARRIRSQWAVYTETILAHHRRGLLTYDIYPCVQLCDGHARGFEWAERQDVSEYQDCTGRSQSFIEGCWVAVARRKGLILPPD